MKEDKLTNSLIKMHRRNHNPSEIKCESEAHYNYYGTRGVADLYIRRNLPKAKEDRVYEIKAHPKNANDVIRQFNKMLKYFYRDESINIPDSVVFELCFLSSKSNLEHIIENKDMYSSITKEKDKVMVTFRHPKQTLPVRIFSEHHGLYSDNFLKFVQSQGHDKYLFDGKPLAFFNKSKV